MNPTLNEAVDFLREQEKKTQGLVFWWCGKAYDLTEKQLRLCIALKEFGELSTLDLAREASDTNPSRTISELRRTKNLPISKPFKKKVNDQWVNFYSLLMF